MEIQLNDEKCAVCGVGFDLVDAIDGHEIIKACFNCAEKSKFPIIQRPTQEQINRANRFYGVRDRLMVNRPDLKQIAVRKETPEDKELKRVIAESAKLQKYEELIDNFHWSIQQGRRMKKLSQKQLAEMIAEPEAVVNMAEQGKLPEDYNRIISKLEQFLKVKLKKQEDKPANEEAEQNQEQSEGEFDIRKANFFKVTTGYLKSLKEKMVGKQEAKEEKREEQEKMLEDEKLAESGEIKG
ncbi:hypothetical protein J4466_05235 [Candidatus Pacearchaeota archaeon]|nr:hypothetical protein [Candidatus Pacearchaeota archaeon]